MDISEETPVWRTRYGTSNPELVDVPLWTALIAGDNSLGQSRDYCPYKLPDSQLGKQYWLSSYREDLPGPIWYWHRFGRTSTPLHDGRIVHVAGAFEDPYDPDYCIYNDVVVQHPSGEIDIYLYPKSVFPPTSFHSATLVGDEIFLIGSEGYKDLRRLGETQVFKLDTHDFRIEPVSATGKSPSWVSGHLAEELDSSRVLIVGGYIHTNDGFCLNKEIYEFDTTGLSWERREHGDTRLFPVSTTEYLRSRSPRPGTSNPERIDNPFWLEMAHRNWPPSRARLQFGDAFDRIPIPALRDIGEEFADNPPQLGTPEFDKLLAKAQEIESQKSAERQNEMINPTYPRVWSAIRDDCFDVSLSDGRILRIGGIIRDYGDEHADAWVYNDIIVTDPQGDIAVLAYPLEDFPRMKIQIEPVVRDRYVFIFGLLFRVLGSKERRQPTVLRLDTATYEMMHVPPGKAPYDISIISGGELIDDDRIVFELGHRKEDDPNQRIAFDFNTLEWSEPLPGRC